LTSSCRTRSSIASGAPGINASTRSSGASSCSVRSVCSIRSSIDASTRSRNCCRTTSTAASLGSAASVAGLGTTPAAAGIVVVSSSGGSAFVADTGRSVTRGAAEAGAAPRPRRVTDARGGAAARIGLGPEGSCSRGARGEAHTPATKTGITEGASQARVCTGISPECRRRSSGGSTTTLSGGNGANAQRIGRCKAPRRITNAKPWTGTADSTGRAALAASNGSEITDTDVSEIADTEITNSTGVASEAR
jgi:hypothetical protein